MKRIWIEQLLRACLFGASWLAVGAKASAWELNFDFCSIDAAAASANDPQQVWGQARVQDEVWSALARLRGSIASAYMAVYVPMTYERDVERCVGSLRSPDRLSTRIGDRLADVMTRYHIVLTGACVEDDGFDPNGAGFCEDIRDISRRNLDAVSAAALLTSTYLSSHMAQSLAAVMLDDTFWDAFPDRRVARPRTPSADAEWAQAFERRMAYFERYKALYDLNNAFLAERVSLVARTLAESCYSRDGTLARVGRLTEVLPPPAWLMRTIRDRTFDAARELAYALMWEPGRHPMLGGRADGRYVVEYGSYRPWAREPAVLRSIKARAAGLFLPFGAPVVFYSVGGQRQDEYVRSGGPSCPLPLRRYAGSVSGTR